MLFLQSHHFLSTIPISRIGCFKLSISVFQISVSLLCLYFFILLFLQSHHLLSTIPISRIGCFKLAISVLQIAVSILGLYPFIFFTSIRRGWIIIPIVSF